MVNSFNLSIYASILSELTLGKHIELVLDFLFLTETRDAVTNAPSLYFASA